MRILITSLVYLSLSLTAGDRLGNQSHHDITEILLKLALNTNQSINQ